MHIWNMDKIYYPICYSSQTSESLEKRQYTVSSRIFWTDWQEVRLTFGLCYTLISRIAITITKIEIINMQITTMHILSMN